MSEWHIYAAVTSCDCPNPDGNALHRHIIMHGQDPVKNGESDFFLAYPLLPTGSRREHEKKPLSGVQHSTSEERNFGVTSKVAVA